MGHGGERHGGLVKDLQLAGFDESLQPDPDIIIERAEVPEPQVTLAVPVDGGLRALLLGKRSRLFLNGGM